MKTSLVERTPGAGRQANFSSGMASASASNWLDTWRHSPSYPCQIPSGAVCASKGRALNNNKSAKSTFLMVCLVSGFLILGRRTTETHSIPRERTETEEELRRSARVRREGLCQCHPRGVSQEGSAREGPAGE